MAVLWSLVIVQLVMCFSLGKELIKTTTETFENVKVVDRYALQERGGVYGTARHEMFVVVFALNGNEKIRTFVNRNVFESICEGMEGTITVENGLLIKTRLKKWIPNS